MLSRIAIRSFVPLALSLAAHGAEVMYSANSSTTTLPFTSLSTTVPQFDPALGSLQALRVTCRTFVQGNLGLENPFPAPTSQHLVYFQAGCHASGPGVTSFPCSGDVPWFAPALAAFDGTLDYAGASGTTLSLPLLSAGYGSSIPVPGSTLDLWTGTGSMPVTAANGYFSISTGGLASSQSLSVFAEFTVIYTYATGPNEFCNGYVGSTTWACPCSGQPGPGGCANSASTSGARLVPSSSSSLGNDTFTLTASNMTPSASVLFFQGTTHSIAGVSFGDGLRCVSGTIVRLGTKTAVNGMAQYPAAGDAPISIRGQIPGAGAQRAYQAWYRDPADFCTPATFNLTSAVRTIWTL